jgi:hypothetical protein
MAQSRAGSTQLADTILRLKYMIPDLVKFSLDDVGYTVNPESSGGQFLVAFGCADCRWSDVTPLDVTVAGATGAGNPTDQRLPRRVSRQERQDVIASLGQHYAKLWATCLHHRSDRTSLNGAGSVWPLNR